MAAVEASLLYVPTTMELDLGALEPVLHSMVFDLSKQHNLKADQRTEQKVIFEGSFEDITHFHQAIKKFHDDPRAKAPLHVHPESEVQEAAGRDAPKAELEISSDQSELSLKFRSRDYEWLNQVWPAIALEIQQYYQVEIVPEVHLNIRMNMQDGSCHAEKLETLKASVQSLITGMENVSISGVKRPNVLEASSKTQKGSLLTTETHGEVVDIPGAKKSSRLLRNDQKNCLEDKLMLIANMKGNTETSTTSAILKIRKVHWRLMEDALKKELEFMNCTYQVIFKNYFTGNLFTILKNKDARRDIPMQALTVFSVLYEQSVKSCISRAISSQFQEFVIKVFKKRQSLHPGVQLTTDQQDGIALVGLPQDVEEAAKDIEEELGQKVFQDRDGQLSESSSIKTKGKNDEEEKCSICMNLYVNKMITSCNHCFCMECWELSIAFQPVCPTCKRACEKMEKNQPDGSTTNDIQQPPSNKESPEDSTESRDQNDEKVEDKCHICMELFVNKMTAPCKHSFCTECWEQATALRHECPVCGTHLGIAEGIQPEGYMKYKLEPSCHLPFSAYPCGSIEIEYFIPSGVQSDKHPDPGQPYNGIKKRAYLPDNPEGRKVLRLLQKAFEQKLIFTIQESEKVGAKYRVTWSDIDHKTCKYGGPTEFGYPDPDYLKRVTDQLHAKGIH